MSVQLGEIVACAALVTTAVVTASASALATHPSPRGIPGRAVDDVEAQVSMRHAIALPLFASGTLMLLFFMWRFLLFQYVLVLLMGVVLVTSLATCLVPLLGAVLGPLGYTPRIQVASSSALAVVVLVAWPLTGHWLLNNVCGIGMCTMMVRTLKLPSLRIAAVALLGLLVYDVYWVFLSPMLFGRSVMVAVAQQRAQNIAHDVAAALPLINQLPPSWLPPPQLDMPNKLVFPVYYGASAQSAAVVSTATRADSPPESWLRLAGYVMLGLGDIALPALFIAYARGIDSKVLLLRKEGSSSSGGNVPDPITPKQQLQPDDVEAAVAIIVPAQDTPALQSPVSSFQQPGPDDSAAPLARARVDRVRLAPYLLGLLRQLAAASSHWWHECFVLPSYLRAACWGYAAGVVAAMLIARSFHVAQPALLYIVPCTLLPVAARSVALGSAHRALVWTGEATEEKRQRAAELGEGEPPRPAPDRA